MAAGQGLFRELVQSAPRGLKVSLIRVRLADRKCKQPRLTRLYIQTTRPESPVAGERRGKATHGTAGAAALARAAGAGSTLGAGVVHAGRSGDEKICMEGLLSALPFWGSLFQLFPTQPSHVMCAFRIVLGWAVLIIHN